MTALLDPLTIDAVNDLLARLDAEPAPVPRAALRRDLTTAAHVLMGERDRLRQKLTDGDAWLTANPDAPDVEARTDTWIGWLHEYGICEDALSAARKAMG